MGALQAPAFPFGYAGDSSSRCYNDQVSDDPITIVVPTIGRPTLERTLLSVTYQLGLKDEVVVIGDGAQPRAAAICDRFGHKVRYIDGPETREWGHAQRNLGMAEASGHYLAFMDDDDVYLPGAIETMHRAIHEHGPALYLFKIKHLGGVIWKRADIGITDVSTQMILVANRQDRLPRWRRNADNPTGGGGDYQFILETAYKWNKVYRFREEVIAEVFRHAGGAP